MYFSIFQSANTPRAFSLIFTDPRTDSDSEHETTMLSGETKVEKVHGMLQLALLINIVVGGHFIIQTPTNRWKVDAIS